MIPHPEGGFFLETFRSGSKPMSSRGQTDLTVPSNDLVEVPDRNMSRPDGDIRRNCLTSIFWVPTTNSPILPLTINQSDHVHYYQGGQPFEYTVYNPETKEVQVQVLGPDICNGQVLQFAVKGGMWKCGRLLPNALPEIETDYTIIAEAVAPGFDFHDFCFVSVSQLMESNLSQIHVHILQPYLHSSNEKIIISEQAKNQDFDSHYDSLSTEPVPQNSITV